MRLQLFGLLLAGLAAQAQSLPLLTPMSVAATLALTSQNANTPTSIDFVNNYGSEVSLYWINYTGGHVLYASVGPGQSYLQATFVTNPWIIYDTATGQPIEGFLPIAQEAEALIVNPSGQAPPSQLQVSPTTLAFSASLAGTSPASQNITVLSAGSAAGSFTVTVDGGPTNATAPSWLKVTPLAGVTPSVLTVSVDPSGLNAGSFSGRILVTPAGAGTATPMDVAVSLTVSVTPQKLSVAPAFLRFTAAAGSPGLQDATIAVSDPGGAGPQSFSVVPVNPIPWLDSISPSAQTSPASPVNVRVRINTNGLAVGGYHGVLQVLSPNGVVDVPIALFVSASGPALDVDQTGVQFDARQGQGIGSVKPVQVFNSGDAGTAVNFTASVRNTANWLTISPTSGVATPSQPASLRLSVNTNAQSLAAGAYYSLVEIVDSKSNKSPQYIVVVLDVAPNNRPVAPDPSPAGLVLTAAGSATITVGVSSASPASFTSSAVTSDGAKWLSVSPASGSVSTASSAQLNVAANPAGLKAGVYTGLVNIAIGSQVRGVNVTLIVPAGIGAFANLQTAHLQTPGATPACVPTRVVLTETGLSDDFTVTAGEPASVSTAMNDDCGNALAGGSVFASFSNGDPPISLLPNGHSFFSGTWEPGNATSNMTITVRGSSGALQPSSTQITGGLTPNPKPEPILYPNGTVNNYYAAAALSPGLIAQVYGSNLFTSTAQPGTLPLPGAYQGTSVMIGSQLAPLYYLSAGQINIQVPTELTPGQTRILISVNGAYSLPDLLDINPLQAGIAAYADGSNNVIAQHADFSYVDANHPAKPSEVVIIYLAGMGATNPAVPSGQGAPTMEPLARVVNMPTVTVDGQNAPVSFAGLAPGFVGLYQIDLQVPANAKTGSMPLVVTQNGVAGNTTNLLVGQ